MFINITSGNLCLLKKLNYKTSAIYKFAICLAGLLSAKYLRKNFIPWRKPELNIVCLSKNCYSLLWRTWVCKSARWEPLHCHWQRKPWGRQVGRGRRSSTSSIHSRSRRRQVPARAKAAAGAAISRASCSSTRSSSISSGSKRPNRWCDPWPLRPRARPPPPSKPLPQCVYCQT